MTSAAQPQVSVVVKSYNHAAFIGETIRSILDQSFQDFEIVVTDDGSSDGTPDVVRAFSDPRIRLEVFPHNRGISQAMNATIARARGKYIATLNSDDFALPGRLERQTAFLEAHPNIGAVFGLPCTVDERGQPTKSFFDFTLPFSLADFSRRSWLKYFFFKRNCLCAPTVMIRRSVYDRVGPYDPRLTNLQDLDMWVRICTGHDIHVMREEVTAFRIRDGNRNMSAPRLDVKLRAEFEFARILRNYRALSPDFVREIFGEELAAAGVHLTGPHERWLAELALREESPAHRLFALETLFDIAQDDADARRLRDLAGSHDVFGLLAADEHRRATAEKSQIIAGLEARLNDVGLALQARDAQVSALQAATATHETETAALRQAVAKREGEKIALRQTVAQQEDDKTALRRMMDELLASRSWRYTKPLRWISDLMARRK
jgi:glycosyltransferase involved in cell wall biosynthesis